MELELGSMDCFRMKTKTLGIIYIIIGLAPIISALSWRWEHILWFSNHIFVIMGLAILYNNRAWLLGSLSVGALIELIWSVDYILYWIKGGTAWGITDYMFTGPWWSNILGLIHILVIPAGIYGLYLMKGKIENAWKYGLAHGIIMYIISLIISQEYNLNCVHRSCVQFTVPYYQVIWPFVSLGFLFASLYIIRKIVNKIQ